MSHVSVGIHCTLQKNGEYMSDGNSAVAVDGKPLTALAEERVSRKKYDGHFRMSLEKALSANNLRAEDVDEIGVSTFAHTTEGDQERFDHIRDAIADVLPGVKCDISFMNSHHEAHAFLAASYADSSSLLVAVYDNEGSILGSEEHEPHWANPYERTSYFAFKDGKVSLIARDHDALDDVGYGKAYSKVTRHIGFGTYHDAGKTMGLAPFGDERFMNLPPLFLDRDGELCEMRNTDDGLRDLADWFAAKGVVLDPARTNQSIRVQDACLARWVQESLQISSLRRLTSLVSLHELDAVAIAGGVALNSVLNSYLREKLDVGDVTVPPSPGDAGLSLGALSWLDWKRTGEVPKFPSTPFLGPCYGEDEVEEAIEERLDEIDSSIIQEPEKDAARMIANSGIVGWFQGGSEFGPRALGNRSILGDPRNPWLKEVLNNQVKNREWFRPFAPAIVKDDVDSYFVPPNASPYMMHIAKVRPEMIDKIPSTTHVDKTARLQVVERGYSLGFYELIKCFKAITGIPIVLNTSFNLGGEPIVESPRDALTTFLTNDRMDALYLHNRKVVRKQ